ncbi:taste receptor type 2 member 5 [Cebus imitator]|uniref:taste receptor type 2 member 5 n=1 Tax=Cebus imitator TaxID=2715852 RepID=UPI00080A2C9D|nr:taste receptor type 2 member 5 [Cebus imitator]
MEIQCLWYCLPSLGLHSGFLHVDANTEGIIISNLSIPRHSYSVLLEDRLQKDKVKSRFCGVKIYPGALSLPGDPTSARSSESLPSPAMLSTALRLLMLVAVVEFLIGLIGNGVLVVWSFREWMRKFSRSSYNLLILGLAGCRFLLQWLIILDLSLFPLFQSSLWLRYLSIFWVLVSQASLWFATFLGVFYCKKITACDHPAYLWLKQRAYNLSLLCLLWYFIITLFLTVQIGLMLYCPPQGNSTILYPFASWQYFYVFRLNSGSGLPFIVFLVSSGMLIVSLYTHHRKMKVHSAGRRDARATAHITALKSLGCFLLLHLVYVIASPFSITSKTYPPNLTSVLISETVMAAYPSLHSLILIMGIPRVKQTCQKILRKTVCARRCWGP